MHYNQRQNWNTAKIYHAHNWHHLSSWRITSVIFAYKIRCKPGCGAPRSRSFLCGVGFLRTLRVGFRFFIRLRLSNWIVFYIALVIKSVIITRTCWNGIILSYLALFYFLVVSRARVHFCCARLIVWLALIVCDVALVLCASSLVQKSLFGWHPSCCFIHCMSLDRSLRTRRISLIKPSLGHINLVNLFLL